MDEQAMMDDEPVAALIFADAERYAAGKGYTLGEGADHQFRYIAGVAASQIAEKPDDAGERQAMTAEAKRAFHAVIDAMIASRSDAYAGDAERMDGNIIGEITLAMAHNKLCPIWPFC